MRLSSWRAAGSDILSLKQRTSKQPPAPRAGQEDHAHPLLPGRAAVAAAKASEQVFTAEPMIVARIKLNIDMSFVTESLINERFVNNMKNGKNLNSFKSINDVDDTTTSVTTVDSHHCGTWQGPQGPAGPTAGEG